MNNREIEVVEYDPNWAIKFDIERVMLQEALGNTALNIEIQKYSKVLKSTGHPSVDQTKSITYHLKLMGALHFSIY